MSKKYDKDKSGKKFLSIFEMDDFGILKYHSFFNKNMFFHKLR